MVHWAGPTWSNPTWSVKVQWVGPDRSIAPVDPVTLLPLLCSLSRSQPFPMSTSTAACRLRRVPATPGTATCLSETAFPCSTSSSYSIYSSRPLVLALDSGTLAAAGCFGRRRSVPPTLLHDSFPVWILCQPLMLSHSTTPTVSCGFYSG
jgi:hypothetical protein